MNSKTDKSGLPAKPIPSKTPIRPKAAVGASIGFLPKTGNVESDEKIRIARQEGYDSRAIELALSPPAFTSTDKLRLLVLTVVASLLVIVFFPFYRFFKPAPRDLGLMSLGGPIMEGATTGANAQDAPWVAVLIEIDRLYFQEGRLSKAIAVAESALGEIPQKDRELWQKVFYRYWELLSDAGRFQVLKTSAKAYLTAFPEDPFANYYHARAVLTAADRMRTYTPKTKSALRQEAESVAQQINRACKALEAQKQHPRTEKGAKGAQADLYQKLRLEQAKLYVLIWKIGGYEEDEHPDVVYRDKALDICESQALVDKKEAKALKAVIYRHILDRWYWIEGRQIIQNQEQKRTDLRKKLDALTQDLQKSKKL